MLASSLKLEFPLNDAVPSTDNARDRLLAKIYAYRQDDRAAKNTTDKDYALLYAYGMSVKLLFVIIADEVAR